MCCIYSRTCSVKSSIISSASLLIELCAEKQLVTYKQIYITRQASGRKIIKNPNSRHSVVYYETYVLSAEEKQYCNDAREFWTAVKFITIKLLI